MAVDDNEAHHSNGIRLVSWNLLHRDGASLDDLKQLIDSTSPDILLMQEALPFTEKLALHYGGFYDRIALKGRRHGTACWSRLPFAKTPLYYPLPSGPIVSRHAQILHFKASFGIFSLANVHLSHRQILNRRQLYTIRQALGPKTAIIGDFNMVGPSCLSGFSDLGPKGNTHKMLDILPLRLDRCLVRGLKADEARILASRHSDHHPISLKLHP